MFGKVKTTFNASGAAKLDHAIDTKSIIAASGSVAIQPPTKLLNITRVGKGSENPFISPTEIQHNINRIWFKAINDITSENLETYT